MHVCSVFPHSVEGTAYVTICIDFGIAALEAGSKYAVYLLVNAIINSSVCQFLHQQTYLSIMS